MSPESEAIQGAAAEFIRDRHRLGVFIGGLLRDSHAAEDVIQEVWVQLAKEVANGGVPENQPAWCRGVARNLIRRLWEQWKAAKVVVDSPALELLLERVDMAFSEADAESEHWTLRQRALEGCVAVLPERVRKMLSMRYESRASMEEVALAMGQAFEAVTKALYRVRRALRECVEHKLSQGA
jgi:RNA polymerase sigma-70 factor, ECF subfamily